MKNLEIPRNAQLILDLLEAAGYSAYVVGGCVRDALLGRTPHDWDITTSARPGQTKAVAEAAGLRAFDTGADFGTVTILADGESYETTTFRADGSYSDGRHPDSVILLDDVDGDLARRDFTVNAMAYNPKVGLVDLFGGQEDLRVGILRCVGEPERRFEEDALRILRALRFASTYGFQIADATAEAIHQQRKLLSKVSAERVGAEFMKLLVGNAAVPVLRAYRDVVAVIIPELEPEFGFDQHNPFHRYDVWEHTLHALDAAPADMDATVRLAVLLHDIGKPHCLTFEENGRGHTYGHEKVGEPIAREACHRLRLSRAATSEVCHIVRWHMFSIPDTPKSMRRFLLRHGEQMSKTLFAVRRCDKAGLGREQPADSPLNVAFAKAEKLMKEQLEAEPVFGTKDLTIGGRDLLEMGYAQGPVIGRVLQMLLEAVVDGELPNQREVLLARGEQLRAQVEARS